MNTYQQMLDLVQKGYAKVSVNANLSTFKYAKKVMFKYLWNEIPGIMECRGHTYDNTTGELIVAAPRKSFNYLENDHWKDVPLDTQVIAYKKYNGFMACVTWRNGVRIVSTTGSTKSDYVKMAEELLPTEPYEFTETVTALYEIIHDNDPHIVDEGPARAVILGFRFMDGFFDSVIDGKLEVTHPAPMTLAEAIEMTDQDRGEGFMIYKLGEFYSTDKSCCKLKTPYYVGKKKLMRANQHNVAFMYNQTKSYSETLPAMWKDVPLQIVNNYKEEEWKEMNDQQRRAVIEGFNV